MAILALAASPTLAQTVQGTATYRERMALPAGAVLEAVIEDVSRADAPAAMVARTRVVSPGQPPIAFTIAYDPARILADNRYAVRARILPMTRSSSPAMSRSPSSPAATRPPCPWSCAGWAPRPRRVSRARRGGW
jgi:hypothetical protein